MVRTALAYIIALALAPTFSALVNLLPAFIVPLLLPKADNPRSAERVLIFGILSGGLAVAQGFAAVWFARLVFGWLGVHPTIWVAWVLGLAFALNDFPRLRASIGTPLLFPRFTQMVGDLGGIALGAVYLL